MGSDIARRSYDRTRKYTGVVPQQGRVTVESDQNEAREIAGEELRLRTLDIVGPQGTPDMEPGATSIAIHVTDAATRAISVDYLTVYVGGLRISIDGPLHYDEQPEWLDGPKTFDGNAVAEIVYLYLEEQEVSAVEDTALQEVALGGPDTATRTRIRTRLRRTPSSAGTCGEVWNGDGSHFWEDQGLYVHPVTRQVLSPATLQVVLGEGKGTKNKCEPAANDGYLGADNQMIRVMIVATPKGGEASNGAGDAILWSYDNASALYRVASVSADRKTITLASRPVDELHHPKQGRYVEVLRAGVHLGGDDYAATTEVGLVTKLTQDYGEGESTLTLQHAIPAAAVPGQGDPPLFVRVWENLLPIGEVGSNEDGTVSVPPIELTLASGASIGVSVALAIPHVAEVPEITTFHPGDHWMFAVRPDTPQAVYPARYAESGQPPDGPRRWAQPIAILVWKDGEGEVIDPACMPAFHNLVELSTDVRDLQDRVTEIEIQITNIWLEIEKLKKQRGGCCTLTIEPGQVEGGAALDEVVKELAEVLAKDNRVTLCLKPGKYRLKQPLVLTKAHSGLTIESCGGGAILQSAGGDRRSELIHGLVVAVEASDVTLRGLTFELDYVPFGSSSERLGGIGLDDLEKNRLYVKSLYVAIGVRAIESPRLTVEACTFKLPADWIGELFGACLFAQGNAAGLVVRRCTFATAVSKLPVVPSLRFTYGVLVAPATELDAVAPADLLSEGKTLRGRSLPTKLSGAELSHCSFTGVSAPIVALAQLGDVHVHFNTGRGISSGIWLLSSTAVGAIAEIMSLPQFLLTPSVTYLESFAALLLGNPIVRDGVAIGRGLPLPAAAKALAKAVVSQPSSKRDAPTENALIRLVATLTGARPKGSGATAAAENRLVTEKWQKINDATRFHSALSKLELAGALAGAAPAGNPDIPTSPGGGTTTPSKPGLVMIVSGNDMDAAQSLQPSGPAFAAIDIEPDVYDAGILGENRLRNSSEVTPAALLLLLRSCAITGNVISNEGTPKERAQAFLSSLTPGPDAVVLHQTITWSFETEDLYAPSPSIAPIVSRPEGTEAMRRLEATAELKKLSLVSIPTSDGQPADQIAVTGNVFRGAPILPARGSGTGALDTWWYFNAVTM